MKIVYDHNKAGKRAVTQEVIGKENCNGNDCYILKTGDTKSYKRSS
jgi:hypothetical protein